MADEGSVTRWLGRLRGGHESAAERLWQRYFSRLAAVARRRLRGTTLAVADEEDAAARAFASFVCRVQQGQFADIRTRDGLWRLLVQITRRKALNQRRDHDRQKRRPPGRNGSVQHNGGTEQLDRLPASDAEPHALAGMHETMEQMMSLLPDELRDIAHQKLEGYTNGEIAARQNRSLATIERRLRLIRKKWEYYLDEP